VLARTIFETKPKFEMKQFTTSFADMQSDAQWRRETFKLQNPQQPTQTLPNQSNGAEMIQRGGQGYICIDDLDGSMCATKHVSEQRRSAITSEVRVVRVASLNYFGALHGPTNPRLCQP
jgi:hypothetical protein